MFHHQHQQPQHVTTAHLAQTMTLLGMTSEELKQKVEAELANNPALELIDERRCPTCKRKLQNPGPCPICSRPKTLKNSEPIVFVSSRNDLYDSSYQRKTDYSFDELPDDNIAPSEELPSFVLRQIASDLSIEDRPIAAHVLTSLDEDGLLRIPPDEICRYHHVSTVKVSNVINLIQRADPIGVGSSSPEEALLIQLQVLLENGCLVPEQTGQAIKAGMGYLSRHQYGELAKQLKISKKEAEEIANFITTNLNPYPGRAHWGEVYQNGNDHPQVYQRPDIIVNRFSSQENSPLVVEIILPLRGSLQINPLFRKTIKDAPDNLTEKWMKDLENASLLIKCIQQRNNTMLRLMTFLAEFQRSFIIHGDQYLRPLTRVKVSKILGVHESTISRAVSGKCIQLPTGKIIPVSQFFDSSLPIRAHLIELVKSEKQPFTDSQLASLLAKKGFHIARRTVAKYRSIEGILPAHLRKNQKVNNI